MWAAAPHDPPGTQNHAKWAIWLSPGRVKRSTRMNHPKGEESTSAGERCSNCPQQLCTAAEPSPQELRHCGGGGHLRERNLCGGFCSFSLGGTCGSAHGTSVTPGKARPHCNVWVAGH